MESGKQRLDCTCAVGLGFGRLVLTLWASLGALGFFNVFLTSFGVSLGPYFTRSEKFGGGACTQLFDYKNKALATCTSILCFRSATGSSTGSLVGRPSTRGRIRRLRRAPGRGRYVHVFCVFVVLCRALRCLFGTLGGLLVPLWHLGLPF